MHCVLTAEAAILIELQPIGVVFLVLEGIVVPLLTFRTSQCDLYSHGEPPCFIACILTEYFQKAS